MPHSVISYKYSTIRPVTIYDQHFYAALLGLLDPADECISTLRELGKSYQHPRSNKSEDLKIPSIFNLAKNEYVFNYLQLQALFSPINPFTLRKHITSATSI